MNMDNSAKMLERVRALLAKADSTEFPGEADAFRAKADALMAQYAIDQWMVDKAQKGVGETARPVVDKMNFDWWRSSERSSELWGLFLSTASHCRVIVGLRGYGGGDMPIIGLPSDIQYMDLLFTNLMMQMGKQLLPQVEPDEGLGANVYRLRQAGSGWETITEQVFKAGLSPLTNGDRRKIAAWEESYWSSVDDLTDWEKLKRSGVWTDMKNRLANANRKYIADEGLESDRNRIKPGIYQRSFAIGFVEEVGSRFRAMKAAQRDERASAGAAAASGMEVALRDIGAMARELYDAEFPPEAADKRYVKRGRSVVKRVSVNGAAMSAGREAGAKADIANPAGARVGSRRGLLDG